MWITEGIRLSTGKMGGFGTEWTEVVEQWILDYIGNIHSRVCSLKLETILLSRIYNIIIREQEDNPCDFLFQFQLDKIPQDGNMG